MSKFIKSLGRFKFKSPISIKHYVEQQEFNTTRVLFSDFLDRNLLKHHSFIINVIENQSGSWYDLEIIFDNGMIFSDTGLEFYTFGLNIEGSKCELSHSNFKFIEAVKDIEKPKPVLNSKDLVINKTITNKAEAKAVINELLEYLES